MISHDELRKLAEVATPGSWELQHLTSGTYDIGIRVRGPVVSGFTAFIGTQWAHEAQCIEQKANAAFIAAANPAQVIALLDEIKGLQQDNERHIAAREHMAFDVAQLRAELGATSRKLSEVEANIDERDGKLREVMVELEQAKKDAARYRRIRGHAGFNLNNDFDIGKFEVSQKTANGEAYHWYEEALDRAIDESMQTEEKKS